MFFLLIIVLSCSDNTPTNTMPRSFTSSSAVPAASQRQSFIGLSTKNPVNHKNPNNGTPEKMMEDYKATPIVSQDMIDMTLSFICDGTGDADEIDEDFISAKRQRNSDFNWLIKVLKTDSSEYRSVVKTGEYQDKRPNINPISQDEIVSKMVPRFKKLKDRLIKQITVDDLPENEQDIVLQSYINHFNNDDIYPIPDHLQKTAKHIFDVLHPKFVVSRPLKWKYRVYRPFTHNLIAPNQLFELRSVFKFTEFNENGYKGNELQDFIESNLHSMWGENFYEVKSVQQLKQNMFDEVLNRMTEGVLLPITQIDWGTAQEQAKQLLYKTATEVFGDEMDGLGSNQKDDLQTNFFSIYLSIYYHCSDRTAGSIVQEFDRMMELQGIQSTLFNSLQYTIDWKLHEARMGILNVITSKYIEKMMYAVNESTSILRIFANQYSYEFNLAPIRGTSSTIFNVDYSFTNIEELKSMYSVEMMREAVASVLRNKTAKIQAQDWIKHLSVTSEVDRNILNTVFVQDGVFTDMFINAILYDYEHFKIESLNSDNK